MYLFTLNPRFKTWKYNFIKWHPSIIFLILILDPQCYGEIVSESRKLSQNQDLELRLVQVVARHGARAPEHPYPNDPFKTEELKYWPSGWGQLTELGELQQYELGQFFRRKYVSFLSPKYYSREVYVVSSHYERTIQSAQLAMAGLFARNTTDGSDGSNVTAARVKDIISSSIPVHSSPKETDRLLQPYQQCPRLLKLHKEVFFSHPEVVRRSEPYQDFLKDLSSQVGVPVSAKTFMALAYPINTLLVQSEDPQNLTLPDWGQALLDSKSKMNEYYFIYVMFSLTEEQKRLGTGPILTEMFKNMQRKVSGQETRKFYYYSGHDINLANIMNTLGLFDPIHPPEYSSALIFELYQRPSSQEYVVKLLYKHSTTGENLRDLKIPNCTVQSSSEECNFEGFSKVLQPYLIEDLDSECGIKSAAQVYTGISTLDASLIGLIVILVISLLTYQVCLYHQSKRKYSMQALF